MLLNVAEQEQIFRLILTKTFPVEIRTSLYNTYLNKYRKLFPRRNFTIITNRGVKELKK